jgi:RNA polymerase sigma-70 factor, ECF subfamily
LLIITDHCGDSRVSLGVRTRPSDQFRGCIIMSLVDETRAGTGNDDDSLSAAVHAACDGDEEGFRLVYRTLQPGILRYLRTLVGEEAEDVASDTWVQIVRGLDSFSGAADDFRAWATTIARNRAIDHLRRVQRRPVADAPVEDLVVTRPARENTAESVLASIGTDEAVALLGRLPRDQAEALVLRIVLDLDVETTARILGKREGAVRSAAHRGLRRLAKLFAQEDRRHPPEIQEILRRT